MTLLGVVKTLCTTDHPHKTIIFDTVTKMWDYCVVWLCDRLDVEHLTDIDYGKAHAMAEESFKKPIDALLAKGMGVVFTAHDEIDSAVFRNTSESKRWPKMSRRAKDVILPLADMIGYMFTDLDRFGGTMKSCRYITFKPHSDYEVGDRSGVLEALPRIKIEPKEEGWNILSGLLEKSEILKEKHDGRLCERKTASDGGDDGGGEQKPGSVGVPSGEAGDVHQFLQADGQE